MECILSGKPKFASLQGEMAFLKWSILPVQFVSATNDFTVLICLIYSRQEYFQHGNQTCSWKNGMDHSSHRSLSLDICVPHSSYSCASLLEVSLFLSFLLNLYCYYFKQPHDGLSFHILNLHWVVVMTNALDVPLITAVSVSCFCKKVERSLINTVGHILYA